MRKLMAVSIMAFLLGVAGVSHVLAQNKTVLLRFSTFFPPNHANGKITADWCKEVEKRTEGRVKAHQYAGSTLTPATQTYDSIVQGVADAGNVVLGYTMGKFPLSEVLDFPLGYPSGSVATRLVNAYYTKFRPKELDEVKVMYLHGLGPGFIHSRKPVAKLEDLRGVKIRTHGPISRMVSLLGGTPVAMPMGDAYDAISKGVVDGIATTYEALEGWKLGEVIKYTTEDYGVTFGAVFIVAVNKQKWNAISPQDQKIIEAINQEWIEKQGRIWDLVDESGKSFSLKRGNKIIKLSPEEQARWIARLQPMFQEYVEKMKAKGLPGDQVLRFARDYLKANKKK